MRTVRVYSGNKIEAGATVELGPEASQHLSKVLRLRVGQEIVVFDGSGQDYAAIIESAARKAVVVAIQDTVPTIAEAQHQIHLWHGLCRGTRMDQVIQKATELGVASIQPVFTTRGVVQLDEKRIGKRLQHWNKVVISAAEQSGRSQLPTVYEPQQLTHLLDQVGADRQLIMLDPDGETGLGQTWTASDASIVLSGPEGGFTEQERKAAIAAGFQCVSMGPRILRTETAPIAALAVIQCLAGEMD